MARFAPVVPLHIAKGLKNAGSLGNYHLLLAHDVRLHPSEYDRVYGHLKEDFDAVVIIDNSVVELGQAVPVHHLVEATQVVKCQYLVIPDVMADFERTAVAAKEFVEAYSGIPKESQVPLMGVAQGKTLADVIECAYTLSELPGLTALAIPRILVKYLGTRSEAIHYVVSDLPGLFVHLLGFSDNLLDDVACARMTGVAGIDSAVPIRAALRGQSLTLNRRDDYGPRGNFWHAPVGPEEIEQSRFIEWNLSDIRRWISSRG